MIKRKLLIIVQCLFFVLLFNVVSAQTDCYARYFNQGSAYLKKNYFDQAIVQFQAAKQCRPLTIIQSRNLDSLIADTKKKQVRINVLRRI